MKRLAKLIIKYRIVIVLLTFGLTIWLGYQIKDLKLDADIINSLPNDDSVAVTYKNIGTQFGGNSMGMIILKTDNIFKTSVLENIKQVTDTLQQTDGISTVTSLTNILDIKKEDGGIDISNLLDQYDLPRTKSKLDSLRARVMSKDMYKGNIVSADGTSTIVMFTLNDGVDKQAIAKIVKEKVNSMHLPEKVYFGGMPMMMVDVAHLMKTDMITLLPIALIVIMLLLFLSFQSARGVILPLLSSAISIIWVLGIMQLFGFNLDLISSNIPIVLLAVGSAYTIHVINRVNEEKGKNRKKALVRALTYITVPVFLSGITTVFGFASFIFGAYLTMIRNFGIFTSLGTLFAMIIALVFVPALISMFSMYKRKNTKAKVKKRENTLMGKWFLMPFSRLIAKHPKYISAGSFLLILVSVIGVFQIKTSVNMVNYFEKTNQTRVTEDLMQQKFGGSLPVFVVFKGDMQSPEVLNTMMETEDYMKKYPYVKTTESVADLIKQMDDVMGEGSKIPNSKLKIQQLWFLLEGQDIMPQLVTKKLDEGIIQSRFGSADSKDMENFVTYMNKFITAHSTNDCQISLTGMPSVYVRLNNSLIRSQMTSLGLAILLVIFIVSLVLKSIRKGFYAAVPIIVTIIILFGFMGYVGIALNVATVLVASIALGMGIDYSIHIITYYYNDFKETMNVEESIKNTMMISGKAIIINVVSVAAGFLVLLFSHIVPIQDFGLLVALSMVGSGFAALTLLPVILIMDSRKQLKNKN